MVVVAGDEATVGPIAAALHATGALVALVARAPAARDDVTVHLRADPYDDGVWDRVAMHVEQHLGPVDAVVADASAVEPVRRAFAADLRRRGHGGVVVVEAGDEASDVVRKVLDTQ